MEWISVDDRLPEDYQTVIILRDGEITFSCIDAIGDDWYWANIDSDGIMDGEISGNVTHWMPLPKPPKESEVGHEKQA